MTAPVPAGGSSSPPPWTWSNLDEKPARDLDAAVQVWVIDYNRHLATKTEEIMGASPAWRRAYFATGSGACGPGVAGAA